MASSSSSSPSSPSKTAEAKHEVFLSFRGEDTRNNFISHLYKDLCHIKGIETFIDNDDIQRGDKISESLLKAIENSKIAVVVLSKDYASSTWCLEELAKILDCQESRGLIVLPVFYHVDPSDVKKQSGIFEEAFKRHEEHFKYELEKVQRWRNALTKAADLAGHVADGKTPESSLVDEVADNIRNRLIHLSASDNRDLAGEALIERELIRELIRALQIETMRMFEAVLGETKTMEEMGARETEIIRSWGKSFRETEIIRSWGKSFRETESAIRMRGTRGTGKTALASAFPSNFDDATEESNPRGLFIMPKEIIFIIWVSIILAVLPETSPLAILSLTIKFDSIKRTEFDLAHSSSGMILPRLECLRC